MPNPLSGENRPERIVPKSMHELSGQDDAVYAQLQSDLVNLASKEGKYVKKYGTEKLRELKTFLMSRDQPKRLRDMDAKAHPELLEIYADILADIRQVEELRFRKKLEDAASPLLPDERISRELDRNTLDLVAPPSEMQTAAIRQRFPSGNFLLHTTSAEEAILIAKDGAILTAEEIKQKTGQPWGHSGTDGISFNMNNVRVLRGEKAHFIGFLVSPEEILDESTALEVPPDWAAKFEVRLQMKDRRRPGVLQRVAGKRESLPRVPLNKAFVLVNRADADAIKRILAGHKHEVAGILTYPSTTLRMSAWTKPEGDYELAGKLLQNFFKGAGLHPTIDWMEDLFAETPEIINDTYLSGDARYPRRIVRTRRIVKRNGKLETEYRSRAAGVR